MRISIRLGRGPRAIGRGTTGRTGNGTLVFFLEGLDPALWQGMAGRLTRASTAGKEINRKPHKLLKQCRSSRRSLSNSRIAKGQGKKVKREEDPRKQVMARLGLQQGLKIILGLADLRIQLLKYQGPRLGKGFIE